MTRNDRKVKIKRYTLCSTDNFTVTVQGHMVAVFPNDGTAIGVRLSNGIGAALIDGVGALARLGGEDGDLDEMVRVALYNNPGPA